MFRIKKYSFKTSGQSVVITGFLLTLTLSANSQVERKYVRQGNREYGKDKFSESEISYRRAIDKNDAFPDAVFNTGDALYKQKKYEDAGKQFVENYNMNYDVKKKSASLYNLGNSLLMSKKIKESIDAYKGSLKLDPENLEAKYNLAYAQDLLQQQQQQQQQQQKNQNKDNKDKSDQSQDNQNQDDQKQPQQQQDQQAISKEDAERILNALANDEKEVQEKVKLAKAKKENVRTLKNW
jgi:tetratricopeptide (TPR) repeat protein